jgi:nitrogen fixation protein FixH
MRRKPDSDYRPGGAPWTGRKMLITMLAFFGVIIAVNGLMATVAVGSFRGVIVKSGFVASQDFNESAALLAEQAARGWRVEARTVNGAPALFFRGPDGKPLTGLTVAAHAVRPADGRADAALTVTETAPGLYVAQETVAPGKWRITFTAEGRGPRYAAAADLFVSPGA